MNPEKRRQELEEYYVQLMDLPDYSKEGRAPLFSLLFDELIQLRIEHETYVSFTVTGLEQCRAENIRLRAELDKLQFEFKEYKEKTDETTYM